MELLFLMAFTLHNIEEGLWLPRWSKYAGKYHPQVSKREFHFALIVVTSVGYFITFIFLLFGQSSEAIRSIFLGFVLMMSLNSIFPHLLATIILRRYAPGTLTGMLLTLPVGVTIIINNVKLGIPLSSILISGVIITVLTIASLQLLFKLASKLIDDY